MAASSSAMAAALRAVMIKRRRTRSTNGSFGAHGGRLATPGRVAMGVFRGNYTTRRAGSSMVRWYQVMLGLDLLCFLIACRQGSQIELFRSLRRMRSHGVLQ